jgi:ABC-type glycerol-3-phosphate transport system substrate-binding protein
MTLRIWLPPQFDPSGSSTAGQVLKARLDQYIAGHPDVTLDIRIKGGQDSAGMLETLSLTRSAAPDVLPDLVALSRSDLEAAALKGALHPLEDFSAQLDDPNWYPYARQAGHLQNAIYGLPFAGDALVIVYHPSTFKQAPETWRELFDRQKFLAFIGDDPDSLLVLDLYLSTGNSILDQSNRAFLDEDALAAVLELLQSGRLVPLQSEEAVWQAFADGRADMALVWASQFIRQESLVDTAVMPLPSLDGTPFTLGTVWAWALAGSNSQNDPTAAGLAKWLIDDDFLVQWNQAAGYLSPRPNAQNAWDKDGMFDPLSQSATVIPDNDQLAALGPILQESLRRIINGDPPEEVARAAAEALR